jgi:hypothetical protein
MNIQPDFEELLRLLEENEVEYLVVGGYAVAFHGFPRFTKDIDVFFKASEENIAALRRALREFGFPDEEIPAELFKEKGNIIAFGVEPSRVDMMNEIDGVDFDTAWMNRRRGAFGKVEVNFIGRLELIRNKKSTSRLQDKADAEKLSGIS